MTTADIVFAENAKWFPVAAVSVLSNDEKGVTMHRISRVTAATIAALIAVEPLPLPYALACIDIEGIFDPDCVNGNFPWTEKKPDGSSVLHPGSNPDRSPQGFDYGMCQLKLRYLMQSENLSLTAAMAFALDPSKAIPYFTHTMTGNLLWADGVLAAPPAEMSERWKNRYLIATCAYNFGRAGCQRLFAGAIPSHGAHVMDMEALFAKQLAVPSVFAAVVG